MDIVPFRDEEPNAGYIYFASYHIGVRRPVMILGISLSSQLDFEGAISLVLLGAKVRGLT